RQIAELVGGVPLGIELAAGRLAILHPGDLVEQLTASTAVLEDANGRLGASLERSWRMVDAEARRCLSAIALFPRGGTLKMLASVAGMDSVVATRAMEQLVRASLVVREGRRFRLLDLIRDFAVRRIPAEVRQGLVSWALARADREIAYRESRGVTEYGGLVDAIPGVRRAYGLVVDPNERARLAICLWFHAEIAGPIDDITKLMEELDLVAVDPALAVHVWYARATNLLAAPDRTRAVALADRGLAEARSLGRPSEIVRHGALRAAVERLVGDSGTALELAREVVEYAETHEMPAIFRGFAYRCLSAILSNLGHFEESIRCAYRELALSKETYPNVEISVRTQVGKIRFWLGQTELALEDLECAFGMAEEADLTRRVATAGVQLANALANLGERERALTVFARVAQAAEAMGDPACAISARIGVAAFRPDSERAKTELQEVREFAATLGRRRDAATCCLLLAERQHVDGQLHDSLATYREGLRYTAAVGGWPYVESFLRASLALVVAELSSRQAALAELESSPPGTSRDEAALYGAVRAALMADWRRARDEMNRLAPGVRARLVKTLQRIHDGPDRTDSS
ncbi:MAG: tetratricopeptide repeat protein, partial [Myxococcota bacterium]